MTPNPVTPNPYPHHCSLARYRYTFESEHWLFFPLTLWQVKQALEGDGCAVCKLPRESTALQDRLAAGVGALLATAGGALVAGAAHHPLSWPVLGVLLAFNFMAALLYTLHRTTLLREVTTAVKSCQHDFLPGVPSTRSRIFVPELVETLSVNTLSKSEEQAWRRTLGGLVGDHCALWGSLERYGPHLTAQEVEAVQEELALLEDAMRHAAKCSWGPASLRGELERERGEDPLLSRALSLAPRETYPLYVSAQGEASESLSDRG